MSRLEEIRKVINDTRSGKFEASEINNNSFADDIEYLLNEVERLKEALRLISVPMPGSRDNELVLYYERIAKEALTLKEPTLE